MKRAYRFTLFTSIAVVMMVFGIEAVAQHCPFDSGHMIVVELTDADDKPMFGSGAELKLQEIDNPEADSCQYKKGLLSRSFLPPADAFQQRYSRQGFDSFSRYCEKCAFNTFGFYAVVLGQSERSCMIKNDDDSDFRWVTRKFEIRFSRDGAEHKIAVPSEKIYSMCTGQGEWSRFEPIKLRIAEPSKASFIIE
jgi:hypothetical protein